ncbi:MAG: hypothetical protein V2B13_14105 [Pseudomonadota bacterium]
MKGKKKLKGGFLLVLGVFFVVVVLSGEALAQTQGDVAMQLAAMLGLDSSSASAAITALTNAGVVPAGGWNITAIATQSFEGALYVAISAAITAGTITPPANLGNASALTAAASTAAGVPSSTAVNGIVASGGNQSQANTGATFGSSLAGGAAPGSGAGAGTGTGTGTGTGSGGAGGGGGGGTNVGSKSR